MNKLLAILILVATASAQSAIPTGPKIRVRTLQWVPSISPGVSGYFLYYGTSSSNYIAQVSIPFGGTNYDLGTLKLPQGIYFLTLSVTNALGDESPPSNEISWTNSFPQGPSGLTVK